MSNYWYTLTKTHSKKINVSNKGDTKRLVIYEVQSSNNVADVTNAILKQLFNTKRENRLNKLLYNFDHNNIDNILLLEEYLPVQYKKYASDINQLKEQLSSLYEISNKYIISDIEQVPNCHGCIYDLGGQKDHMGCPTGCLHDSTSCIFCS